MRKIIFQHNENDFWQTLQFRVSEYFREKEISQYANNKMVFKIILMLLALVVPYGMIILIDLHFGWVVLLAIMIGLAMAGIGLSISHQAAHEAISDSKFVNRALSLTFNILGMSDYIWKIKHNVYHHTYTNVFEKDEALKEGDLIRMSKDAPLKPIHKYQHYYTALVYAFFTFFWAWFLDFEKLFRYNAHGSTNEKSHPVGEVILFYLTKIYYVFIVFLIPWYFTDLSVWQIILVYFIVNITASSIITHVLQVEHLTEDSTVISPDDEGKINVSWAVNQLEGTANFKSNSKVFEWFLGGSNYQIEHHLFPKICAVHYPDLSKIVKSTAKEYGLKYTCKASFPLAIKAHYKFLKILGKS